MILPILFLIAQTLLPGTTSTWTDGTYTWAGSPFCVGDGHNWTLQANSPAIDAGALIAGLHCPAAGSAINQPRQADGSYCFEWYGAGPDIGSCEFYAQPVNAATPNDPSANSVSDHANISWTDNSDNEDGFLIQRINLHDPAPAYAEIGRVGANVTTYFDAPINAEFKYCYRVAAFNSVGNSGYSNDACTVASVNSPTGFTAVATSATSIRFSWADNSSVETGYTIETKKGSGQPYKFMTTTKANVTTFEWTNAQKNATYCSHVYATNAGVTSPYSNESCATTPKQ